MKHILVIGGGWAGIAASITAARLGCSVLLVDERQYLGGRSRSFIESITGEEIDNGQHLMMGAYHTTRDLVKELGTEHLLEMQSSLRVPFVDTEGQVDVLDAYKYNGPFGMAWGIWNMEHLKTVDRLSILFLAVRFRLGLVKARHRTCLQLLTNEGQTKRAVKRFWEPIVLATLNASLEEASAELLIAVMRLSFLGADEDSRLLIPLTGLSHLVDPLPQWLAKNDSTVRLSTRCEGFEIKDGKIKQAQLNDGSVVDVDGVVSCIPEKALRRLLGDDVDSPLAAGDYQPATSSPIVSVYLWYDRPWMDEPFMATLGTTVQWVFNRRRLLEFESVGTRARFPGHVSLTISAGSELAKRSQEEIIEQCDKELRSLFGEMQSANLLHGIVIKEKAATPLIQPGTSRPQLNSFVNIASNLAIAGDWTDTGLPATIEGAAQSGVRGAEWLYETIAS